MKFASTRDGGLAASFSEALCRGLAPDGGLYIPRVLPSVDARTLDGRSPLAALAAALLAPCFADDVLETSLAGIADESLDFDAPLRPVEDGAGRLSMLELFHGPTAAFKDFGARFLAACFARLRSPDAPALTILVATSGDTGGAVAAAFDGRPGIRVVLLYPEGRVSPIQAHQLSCWGQNVCSLAVTGSFDDCQRLVKQAFADDDLRSHVWLTPANSINLGRLLPQVFYYFLLAGVDGGLGPVVSVPSGNFGNLTAGLIAKRIGLPIAQFVAATNVNDAVPEYLESGVYEPRPSIATVANAMDVGAPSNFERVQSLYNSDLMALRQDIVGFAYEDSQVIAEIGHVYREHGYVLDPHSAIAWLALQDRLVDQPDARGVFLATAHPAKFREVVEPAIGRSIELPRALADAISRPRHSISMPAAYNALEDFLRATQAPSART